MRWIVAAALLTMAGTASAQDPQISMDHTIATGQALVLDSMNRANTERMHRQKGLPPPDYKAAERRLRARAAARRPLSRDSRTRQAQIAGMSPAERCAWVSARRARLTPAQLQVYRRACP